MCGGEKVWKFGAPDQTYGPIGGPKERRGRILYGGVDNTWVHPTLGENKPLCLRPSPPCQILWGYRLSLSIQLKTQKLKGFF